MPRLAPPLRHLIFVYGTLKRGLINHERYLALAEEHGAARFVGGGVTTERFPLIVLPTERYSRQPPALLERRGVGNRVRGELFVVDDRTLEGLDILEGLHVGQYYKGSVDVTLDEGVDAVAAGVEPEASAAGAPSSCAVEATCYFFPASDTLLAQPMHPEYDAARYELYQPAADPNEQIVELCRPVPVDYVE